MATTEKQQSLFTEDELQQMETVNQCNLEADSGPVTCLGITFDSDEARREYFRAELRTKLPELRKIEGFPIGTDDDIINLSDPPYYTACPNPWLNDFIAQWEEEKKELVKQGKRDEEKIVKNPYANDVSEGKNNPIYNIHSYHTKVPHPAIMRYILHYTEPGDIVFDGFAGTGMTGVASTCCGDKDTVKILNVSGAKIGKRHAIVSDLSPAASFISSKLNGVFISPRIKKSLLAKIKVFVEKYGWMFNTHNDKGQIRTISSIVWSEEISCPNCGNSILTWNAFADIKARKMRDEFVCPNCGSLLKKSDCASSYVSKYDFGLHQVVEQKVYKPALLFYKEGSNRLYKIPDQYDLDVIEKIEKLDIPSWFPNEKFLFKGEHWGDSWRAGIHYGITNVHHFYTKRNLFFISQLWSVCDSEERFVITSALSRNLTILNRYILKPDSPYGRINGPLSGTLYIPSEYAEQNPIDLLISKIPEISWDNNGVITSVNAAQSLSIGDESIDYIFTDPPFGDNIMYSELNFLWESWLKVYTNNLNEAIENESQHKGITEYNDLMFNSFKEYYRILKPGKWITVEFSNTRAAVWNSIQSSLTGAGFIIANVAALDKKHGGIKSMTYTTTVKEDLVISCFKPSSDFIKTLENSNDTKYNVWGFVEEYLMHLPVHIEKGNATTTVIERSPKILYDRLISYYVQRGYPVPLDATAFQQGLRERYIEKDGMFFTAYQAAEYEEKKKLAPEFVPMGIIVSDEANGIEWLKNKLRDCPKTYQEIQPEWMQAINGVRKGDILPELATLLEENFIEMPDGKWRLPNIQDDVDKEALRTKALLREFKLYVEQAQKPRAKIKEARVEALRAGFKQCYIDKDFATIVLVGDKIPQNLRDEDEVLLQFYDIALNKM